MPSSDHQHDDTKDSRTKVCEAQRWADTPRAPGLNPYHGLNRLLEEGETTERQAWLEEVCHFFPVLTLVCFLSLRMWVAQTSMRKCKL